MTSPRALTTRSGQPLAPTPRPLGPLGPRAPRRCRVTRASHTRLPEALDAGGRPREGQRSVVSRQRPRVTERPGKERRLAMAMHTVSRVPRLSEEPTAWHCPAKGWLWRARYSFPRHAPACRPTFPPAPRPATCTALALSRAILAPPSRTRTGKGSSRRCPNAWLSAHALRRGTPEDKGEPGDEQGSEGNTCDDQGTTLT